MEKKITCDWILYQFLKGNGKPKSHKNVNEIKRYYLEFRGGGECVSTGDE